LGFDENFDDRIEIENAKLRAKANGVDDIVLE